MTTRHTHRPMGEAITRAWTRCVDPRHKGNHPSHGNVVYLSRCRCGARRTVEANRAPHGSSGWIEDTTDQAGIAANERLMARERRDAASA